MSPEARKASNAAMSAYWGSKDDSASPGEAGFKAGMLFAARLCRERAKYLGAHIIFAESQACAVCADEIEFHARCKT